MREYFYNEYVEMYCVIGETYASDDLNVLEHVCGEMTEVEMPDYITENYDDVVWQSFEIGHEIRIVI